MIEIRCDRCGGIIREKYFTININEEYLNHKPEYATITAVMDGISSYGISSYSYSQQDLLCSLNSRPIYCTNCVDEIGEFIKHKP